MVSGSPKTSEREGGNGKAAPKPEFPSVARLTAQLLGVPAAVLTLINGDGEIIAGGSGLHPPLALGVTLELPAAAYVRDGTNGDGAAAVPADANFARTGVKDTDVVSVLAVEVTDFGGRVTGSLAALDYAERTWTVTDAAALKHLATLARIEVECQRAGLRPEEIPKALAQASHESSRNDLYAHVVEQPLVGLFTIINGQLTYANPGLAAITGFSVEELLELDSALELLKPDQRALLADQMSTVDALSFCTPIRRKDGSGATVEVRLGRSHFNGGRVVVGSLHDVTEVVNDRVDLARREERFRASFERNLAGLAVASRTGQLLSWNEEFARLTGLEWPHGTHDASLDRIKAEPGFFGTMIDRLRDATELPPEEIELIARNGSHVRVITKLTTNHAVRRETDEIFISLIDVTQRSTIEQALQESEERMQLLELATHDVLWDWNVLSGVIVWNYNGDMCFRYARAEIRPSVQWHGERVHPEDRERVAHGLDRMISGIEGSWSEEYRFLRGDGTYATVLDRACVIRNRRGQPRRVIGWMADITDRKRAEEAQRFLARAGSMLEATLDVYASAQSFARLCVPTVADVCIVDLIDASGGWHRAGVTHIDPAREEHLRANMTAGASTAFSPNPVVNTAAEAQTADGDGTHASSGQVIPPEFKESGIFSYMVVPMIAHGRNVGVVTFGFVESQERIGPMEVMLAQDVAHRGALAIDNARSYETAGKALSVRDEVLRVVSHDLRVPLSTIVAAASLLRENNESKPQQLAHWLELIQRAAGQMNTLINDLLDASQMAAQVFRIEPERQSLLTVIEGVAELLRPLATSNEVSLAVSAEDSLPPLSIDARQIQRVLMNLIGNAIKFSPRGSSIALRVGRVADEVHVSIEDQGAGMSPEELKHLFEPFWQANPRERRGSGLGLSIAKTIVEAHSGRIWVLSEKGRGSTFNFALPLPANEQPGLPGDTDPAGHVDVAIEQPSAHSH